uniref:Putative nuclear factor of activated t-cells n=1 Tax=Ixodes ricinus TaxID=34613 RepID=A0A6B0VCU6_IXORI
MGKITNRPQADTQSLSSAYFTKGSLLPVGVVSSAPKAEQHASLPGPPVNLERVPLYQEQLELSYPELNSLSSALADRYHRMESNMSTLDCTSDTTNLHEDSVSSTVRETNQDTSSLLQEPNSMLVRMLHMTVKEDHSWLGALSAGNPASSVSSPSSSRASLSPPPHSPRRGGTLGGASPLAVSEEATLGDTLACAEPPDAPSTSRAAAPDFHNLQTALRALIKEVTQASPQESHCSQGSSICGATRSLLSADSTTGRPSGGVFASPVSMVAKGGIARRVNQVAKRPTLYMSFPSRSRRGDVELKILSQPEEQHRARYLTEGSRGAVKDRTGMGFPTVKLVGLQEQVKLQVFIGTDQGKVQPHMFYQASRVCGKNSTPCQERRLDGTTVLEVDMLPAKDMTVSCDCVGILKERNVDVEKRLVRYGGTRNKKRSTKCRLVFRVCLPAQRARDSGGLPSEILQVASAPILCTQPPGIPEISKKSLTECSVKGDMELFIIGKNFLKDTKVVFKEPVSDNSGDCEPNYIWEKFVVPEKEYLQPTHLICRVPAYRNLEVAHMVLVHLVVTSGGRASEPHPFTYVPLSGGAQMPSGPLSAAKSKQGTNIATGKRDP